MISISIFSPAENRQKQFTNKRNYLTAIYIHAVLISTTSDFVTKTTISCYKIDKSLHYVMIIITIINEFHLLFEDKDHYSEVWIIIFSTKTLKYIIQPNIFIWF